MKKLCLLLVISLAVLTIGCKENTKNTSTSAIAKGEVTYPIDSDAEITIWENLTANISAFAPSANDIPFTEGLRKRTGINIRYIHPPVGQEVEKFNLILAAGELPDIIRFNLTTTKEGPDNLISGGYVYSLSDEFLEDYSPNYKKKLDSDPELRRMNKTNSGKYYAFSNIRQNDNMTVFQGPIIRKDWLDDLSLNVPETIDDWYTTLSAFKNIKGAKSVLSFEGIDAVLGLGGAFVGAYGVKKDFYIEDGTVKYGPLDNRYQEFLQTFNKWYSQGLIDKNFTAVTLEELSTKILNGDVGASFGMIGSRMGAWLNASKDEKFNLVAAPYPTLNKGEIPKFGAKNSRYDAPTYFISATSKYKEIAARFLDYGYSEEGSMYYNFGTEGESYTLVNGFPTYTDLILKNPDGLSAASSLAKYAHSSYEGAFEMDERFFEQQYPFKQQKEAIKVWSNTNAKEHMILGDIAMTADENKEYSSIMTNIKSYVNEMTTKFIMGIESLDKFEEFQERLKLMNIQRAIEIKQTAYDRFNAR